MEWTEETITQLRHLWSEGLPTAEIGRRLGITKNAVIGKAHRLTLPSRPSPIPAPTSGEKVLREPRRATRAKSFHVSGAASLTAPSAAAPRRRIEPPPFRRAHTCCWPLGEPGKPGFRFCDDPALPTKPYCATHADLAYVKIREKREEAA